MKKIVACFILVTAFVFNSVLPTQAFISNVTFFVKKPDQMTVSFSTNENGLAGIWHGGRYWMSIRGVFEALDYGVTWDAKTKSVIAKNDMYEVIIPLDSETFTTNGVEHSIRFENGSHPYGNDYQPLPTMLNGMAVVDMRPVLLTIGYTHDEPKVWEHEGAMLRSIPFSLYAGSELVENYKKEIFEKQEKEHPGLSEWSDLSGLPKP